MIQTFRCPDTKTLHAGYSVLRFKAFEDAARTRLRRLEAAVTLQDLAAARGNRLKALKGDRRGQYGIRINDQWRICFKWRDGHALQVEIVDYH